MVYGFGIFDGKKARGNPIYGFWSRMIERCYSEKTQARHKGYRGITVSVKWRLYSDFEKWSNTRYRTDWCLDKDIFGKNCYSPDSCAYLPSEINMIFMFRDKKDLPLGVYYKQPSKGMTNERTKPYVADMSYFKENKKSVHCTTPKEAHNLWKNFQSDKILKIANTFKSVLEERVYNRLVLISEKISSCQGEIIDLRSFCKEF